MKNQRKDEEFITPMSVFIYKNLVFKKETGNLCTVGAENGTLGTGSILPKTFKGQINIPPYAIDSSGKYFRVRKLGQYAFRGFDQLKSITLPQTLEVIRVDSLWGTSIEHLFIPASVEIQIGRAHV